MPPNTIDSFDVDPEARGNSSKIINTIPQVTLENADSYGLKVFQSSLNLLAHILIGATVGISILFAFRNGLPLGSTPLHIVLCVLGVSIYLFRYLVGSSYVRKFYHLSVSVRFFHSELFVLVSCLQVLTRSHASYAIYGVTHFLYVKLMQLLYVI